MTPRPLTDKGRRLIAQLANTHDTILSRHVATLLSAEAYWRERAERLAAAAEQAVLDGLAFDRMTGGLETLAEEIGIGTKEPQS